MGHPDDFTDVQTTADQPGAAIAALRNANALNEKLEALLVSKTHQVDALHKELERAQHALDAENANAQRWKDCAQFAEHELAQVNDILALHADCAFLAGDPSTPALARHVIVKGSAGEPDMDTVPLQALLEAVSTFLEHDQAVTIRGSYEPVQQVEIHALGRTFLVDTDDASEALSWAQALGMCLIEER